MEQNDPHLEGFLNSIHAMTGHAVKFEKDTAAVAGQYCFEVRSADGDLFGVLSISTDESILSEEHEALYRELTRLIAVQIELRQQNLTLENRFRLLDQQNAELAAINHALSDIAYRDPLTNLYRRWYLMEQFRLELSRAARYGRPFSVLLIDLDHFKTINDTNGHAAGDAVLRGFSRILQQSCRTSDVLARFGGDEFCALLTDTGLKGAEDVAERVRSRCESELFPYADKMLRITASIGVGSYSKEVKDRGLDADMILEEIDLTMYRAKRVGRNAVQVVDSLSAPA
jgi:diguanylate cyclase (GGDEF)-like protein